MASSMNKDFSKYLSNNHERLSLMRFAAPPGPSGHRIPRQYQIPGLPGPDGKHNVNFNSLSGNNFLAILISNLTEKLHHAYTLMLEHPQSTEDYVGRYVKLLLDRNFTILHGRWSIVPQYYTESQQYPDFVLETWRESSKKKKFIQRVYVEIKRHELGDSMGSALEQTKDALRNDHGREYSKEGIILVVKGKLWLFIEYQFGVGTHPTNLSRTTGPNKTGLLIKPFDDHNSLLVSKEERPFHQQHLQRFIPGSPATHYALDMSNPEDELHCLTILTWIARTRLGEGSIRPIAQGQGYSHSRSVTTSTAATYSMSSSNLRHTLPPRSLPREPSNVNLLGMASRDAMKRTPSYTYTKELKEISYVANHLIDRVDKIDTNSKENTNCSDENSELSDEDTVAGAERD